MSPEFPVLDVLVCILAPLETVRLFAITDIVPAFPLPDVDAEIEDPSVRFRLLVVILMLPASLVPVVATEIDEFFDKFNVSEALMIIEPALPMPSVLAKIDALSERLRIGVLMVIGAALPTPFERIWLTILLPKKPSSCLPLSFLRSRFQ